ncbi:MAG: cation:proton antiporter [Bacteroidales bacterium]|nr:cation:proton antiporter [Bacteroidales bacterium]
MELPILNDIVILLAVSIFIILIFRKFKIPTILGLLITGIIAGPHGLKLIKAVHEVELLSEVGIIFLLFIIGIEFSLKTLSAIKKTVLWGGLMQVGFTVLLTVGISFLFGLSVSESIFLGFLFSLSSTAIVLKILQENGEINSPHGRVAVAILIFQDIIVVPMILVTPIIAGVFDNIGESILILSSKVVFIIVTMILLARYVVPKLLDLVVKAKSREIFILTIVFLCFAMAYLTSSLGLSLALGAFFAGLIISESEYSHQATANILPFKEIFISFFFVSVGMLLNLNFFISHILLIHFFAFSVVFFKILIVLIIVLILQYPVRTAFMTAFAIFQVGEFSFLLSVTGMKYHVLTPEVYQYFLAVSILSMGLTPFLMDKSSPITTFIIYSLLPKKIRKRLLSLKQKKSKKQLEGVHFEDHLVIIGYGINGKNLTKAALSSDISFVISELDPGIVKMLREQRYPVIFGDACDEFILKKLNVHKARVVVIAISDSVATKNIIRKIREISETVYIIVRSKEFENVETLVNAGADDVVPAEFETSIIIFSNVLKKYLIPNDEIQNFINVIRSRNYEMLRSISNDMEFQFSIPDVTITALSVQSESNKFVGKSIGASNFRNEFGVNILAIKRDNRYITELSPNTRILQHDILYIFGNVNKLGKLNEFFKA